MVRIINELYNSVVFEMAPDEVVPMLEKIKKKKETEIDVLKFKIHKFEMQQRVEEAYYQSLSPLKKIFAGRPPSHHQAVEYLVNVKNRFAEIEKIKQQILLINRRISQVQTQSEKENLVLSPIIIEGIRELVETEGN